MSKSAEAAQNLSTKSMALADQASDWLTGNSVDIAIAAAIGIVIALLLLAARALRASLIARRGGDAHWPHWPIIFARVVAKTNLFFIVMASADRKSVV